jgi:hypothetical protein
VSEYTGRSTREEHDMKPAPIKEPATIDDLTGKRSEHKA